LQAELEAARAELAQHLQASDRHATSVTELTDRNTRLQAENQTLQQELGTLRPQLATLRTETSRLAQADTARADAERRIDELEATVNQLTNARRELAALQTENNRLQSTMQALERDRTARITTLSQENAALNARLRQAQGTLDQIAAAARLINPGAGSTPAFSSPSPTAPAPAIATAPEVRLHVVVEGDTLSRISLRYYGTATRWQEIYNANREVLSTENALRPGQRLRIP
jgi:nucleoid-associated protein YgaU